MYLENIKSPKDLKKLSIEELNILKDEVRKALLEKISRHGGHNGPNLGMVELTIALHYIFNSPKDKIVYDVSHQSYVHKMLTGRANAFLNESEYENVSGYTNPKESEHDFFTIGHTSTSLSLANGLAKARDLKGNDENIIAIIGDGSLSGGLAYEGLNNIIEQGTNTIVIVNDNDQSIAKNYGGIYNNLKLLRETKGEAKDNFFKALGFEYHYAEDGHDIKSLIEILSKLKDSKKPVLLHVHTIKGKGFKFAEENREKFHAGGPFSLETGEYISYGEEPENYFGLTTEYLLKKIKEDKDVVVISSGTPMIVFNKMQREEAGKQFVDVGIAEEHATTMSAGLAKGGAKPVYAVFSTFMQRTYDQISHDIALNNQAATILVYSASVYGMNDESHLGFYDIPFLAHIPNMVYLAPTTKEEYLAMLEWSIDQNNHPVAIRVPGNLPQKAINEPIKDYSNLNKNEVVYQGNEVAIFGLGTFFELGLDIYNKLKESGVNASLINPRFITGIDEELLDEISKNHKLIITLEDGILEGGYGQSIASYLGDKDIKVQNYGLKKTFPDRYNASELLAENGIEADNIVNYILNIIR